MPSIFVDFYFNKMFLVSIIFPYFILHLLFLFYLIEKNIIQELSVWFFPFIKQPTYFFTTMLLKRNFWHVASYLIFPFSFRFWFVVYVQRLSMPHHHRIIISHSNPTLPNQLYQLSQKAMRSILMDRSVTGMLLAMLLIYFNNFTIDIHFLNWNYCLNMKS